MADHRVDLADGWTLWKWVIVRGAGFPACEVLKLAQPRSAAAVDAGPDPDDASIFASEAQAFTEAMRQCAQNARFREAVLWQNRHALRTGIDRLLARPKSVNSKDRQREHLVASYLQRYCTKSDTIGFFGPVGWGTFGDEVIVEPGPDLLASRRVYFEYWGIDVLAQRLAEDPGLLPHLAPRRRPTIRIDGTTLFYPIEHRLEVPALYARALRYCDGSRSAQAIARTLLDDGAPGVATEDDVYALLGQLEEQRLITWTLDIPTASAWPEQYLREVLSRAVGASSRWLEPLDELERARDAVARAAGDSEALDDAIGALGSTFEKLTATRATRAFGQTYAGRTLVYEDCRRDLAFSLGPDFLQRQGPVLSMVLKSLRWYTHQVATAYRAALDQTYDALVTERGDPVVDYLRYWERITAHFPDAGETAPLLRQAHDELERRWSHIVGLDPSARSIDLPAAQLSSAVDRTFSAPCPGWPGARHHTLDLAIAATSTEAIRRGDYLVVLGELGPGVNIAAVPPFQDQHDDPGALDRAREIDIAEPAAIPVRAKAHTTRGGHVRFAAHDFDVEIGDARSWRPPSNVLSVGSLVVERQDGHLMVRHRDGDPRFEIVSFLDHYLFAEDEGAGGLPLFPPLPHRPRVTIDNFVLAREQWRFAPEEVAFATAPRGLGQFAQARKWAREHGVPRWVFVKVPEERKPMYVDFESPIYVEMLAKAARKASQVTVTEMLPTMEQLWLPDAQGQRYVCELRMVAVDPVPWHSPRGSQ